MMNFIETLPNEIIELIFNKCDMDDQISLSSASSRLYSCRSNKLNHYLRFRESLHEIKQIKYIISKTLKCRSIRYIGDHTALYIVDENNRDEPAYGSRKHTYVYHDKLRFNPSGYSKKKTFYLTGKPVEITRSDLSVNEHVNIREILEMHFTGEIAFITKYVYLIYILECMQI